MTCYVLDTDHLSLYERGHPQICRRILQSRQQVSERLATTVITIEEQYAGRLAQIRKATLPENSRQSIANARRLPVCATILPGSAGVTFGIPRCGDFGG